MKNLIINADDFGYSKGVNYGIMDAHTSGVLTSTTLMTNMPEASHACGLAAANPELGVGIHLTLTCGPPLVSGHQTIVDEQGKFRTLSYYSGSYDINEEEVYQEWKAQIERAVQFGITPTHLDSHHHIHSYPGLTEVYTSLAASYHLPVRVPFPEKTPGEDSFVSDVMTTDYLELRIDKLKGNMEETYEQADTIEFMTHPAYLDKPLIEGSSFLFPRAEELALLTDDALKLRLNNNADVQLITFRDLL
ncbi:chitin disaccharide deacetylase [Salibacterium sp. K-3]